MVRMFLPSLLFLVVSKVVVGQQCSADTATNFTTCLFTNLNTCSGCNTSTVTPPSSGTFTCASITAQVCPTVKCCHACEASTFDYFQNCLVSSLSSIVGSCNLDCSAYPYGDTNVNNTEPCLGELGNWTSCLFKGKQDCASCVSPNSTLALFNETDTCANLGTFFCYQVSCCQGCKMEAQSYYSCLFESQFNCTSLGNCTAGSSAPIAPTTVISTGPPVSPTTPAPITSTTSAPSVSAQTTTSSPSVAPAPSASTPTTISSPSVAPAPFAPTALTPTSSSTACGNATSALTFCLGANILFCTSCYPTAFNASHTTTTPQSCQAASNSLCPLYTCCPRCSSEVQALFRCEIAREPTLSNCVFNCGGSNSTTSAAATMKNPWWGLPMVVTSVFAVITSVAVH